MDENSMNGDTPEIIPPPPPPERGKDAPVVRHGGHGGRSVQPPETGAPESPVDVSDPATFAISHASGLSPERTQSLKDAVDGLQEELSKPSDQQDQARIALLRGELGGEDVPAPVKSLVDSMFQRQGSDDDTQDLGEGSDEAAAGPRNAEEEEQALQAKIEEAQREIAEARTQEDVDLAVKKFKSFGKGLKYVGHGLWIAAVVVILTFILTNKLVANG